MLNKLYLLSKKILKLLVVLTLITALVRNFIFPIEVHVFSIYPVQYSEFTFFLFGAKLIYHDMHIINPSIAILDKTLIKDIEEGIVIIGNEKFKADDLSNINDYLLNKGFNYLYGGMAK